MSDHQEFDFDIESSKLKVRDRLLAQFTRFLDLLEFIKRDSYTDMSLIGVLDTSSSIIVGRSKVDLSTWWVTGVNPAVTRRYS